jgi:DNA-binding IclR family transcriptional regulator
MIQVIGRTFQVLELLSPNVGQTLDSLSQTTGLNKGTLCNILKTLTEIEYVEKHGPGSYRLSPKLLELTKPFSLDKAIEALGKRRTQIVAKETKESCVVCSLRENNVHIIAQTQYERNLIINAFAVYKDLSLYNSVCGRVLIAFLSKDKQKVIADSVGFPGTEWDNISSVDGFEKAAAGIVKDELIIMYNEEKEIASFAVPVFDNKQQICASIGVTAPIFRVRNTDVEEKIIKSLRLAALKMTKELIKENMSQNDFIKLI